MTIAKCKKCEGVIITPEHLENKKNILCKFCVMKNFVNSKVDGYIICKRCGIAVSPTLRDTNKHLQNCSAYVHILSQQDKKDKSILLEQDSKEASP